MSLGLIREGSPSTPSMRIRPYFATTDFSARYAPIAREWSEPGWGVRRPSLCGGRPGSRPVSSRTSLLNASRCGAAFASHAARTFHGSGRFAAQCAIPSATDAVLDSAYLTNSSGYSALRPPSAGVSTTGPWLVSNQMR